MYSQATWHGFGGPPEHQVAVVHKGKLVLTMDLTSPDVQNMKRWYDAP